MANLEELFNFCVLQVFAPGSALEFPSSLSSEAAKDWLGRLYAEPTDRKVAFFDENIDFLLVIRFPQSQEEPETSSEHVKPPTSLLSFLAHLQISYDASYISPFTSVPSFTGSVSEIGRPPPRTTSINKDKPVALLAATHPSIFPPSTPNPVPSATKSDQQYVQSQGTPLTSGVWGEHHHLGPVRETSEAFALLWAANEREWVAIYRMSVLVRYMTTKFENPLLSLTVSTTLREKPLPVTPPRKAIAALIEEAGGLSSVLAPLPSAKSPVVDSAHPSGQDDDDDMLSGMEEINLLEGLQADPTFASSEKTPLRLPSTRLGPKTRRTAFSLPPIPGSSTGSQQVVNETPLPASTMAKTKLPPPPSSSTFRKSFRKTIKVVSGFHVRMRTVFVPYFLLPLSGQKKRKLGAVDGLADGDDEDDLDLDAREQREAGNEEHTVVLSVEIENTFPDIPSPTIPNYCFEIERADVTVSGTGAKTVLVAWGEGTDVLPVRIGPNEQVNLLYAVSFLRTPDADELALAGVAGMGGQAGKRTSVASEAQDMRRSVSINISVRPFEQKGRTEMTTAVATGTLAYPTRTYASYWSCKLNFSSASSGTGGRSGEDGSEPTALPTPASPFPNVPPPRMTVIAASSPAPSIRPQSLPAQNVAGSRKLTYSALDSPAIEGRAKLKSPANYQGPIAMLNPANQPQSTSIPLTADPRNLNPIVTGSPASGGRASLLPPSLAFHSTYARSPTTYTSPQDSYFTFSALGGAQGQSQSQTEVTGDEEPSTPRTPAYPAYPGSPPPVPPTPFWQAPLAQQTGAGAVGPTVDMRRDRGGGGTLPTPGLTVSGFPSNTEVSAEVENKAEAGGQPIVVSVGLLPVPREDTSKEKGRRPGDIYPLDQFTLDIFVFNQSSWTRRFEVSHPDDRRRRRKEKNGAARKGDGGSPGIVPVENRVRIGPLLPSTCQSVRMDFLALTPGVHSIDELVLTDIQSGFSMHLRSVMEVVVCEPLVDPS